MNKSDVYLILFLLLISIVLFLLFKTDKNIKYVNIYYENKLIKRVDLSVDNTYVVSGYNGEVVVEVKNNMIRVKEENSPLHICSKQGFANGSIPIICLPNKIIIKSDDIALDAVIS